MRPMGATADRATARLGAGLHIKGEITGNEDLVIDGSVEGLVQLDERKLMIGVTKLKSSPRCVASWCICLKHFPTAIAFIVLL